MLDAVAEIEEFVVRFEGRAPGTDAERRAGRHIAGRLEQFGRSVETEPAWVYPNVALAHVGHATVAILASIVAIVNARVGVALALAAAVSAYGDLNGHFYLLRRLTGRRATQTVASREDGDKPGTLVLVAHYDAAHAGALLGRAAEARALVSKVLHVPIGPFDPFALALFVIVATSALRAAGISVLAVSIAQFVATVALILGMPALVEVAIAGVVPGASDNASGVATVLRLTERYGSQLDHFRLWALFPGASEGLQLGMRDWIRRHKRELDARRTIFVNIDGVGSGTVRYLTREGFPIGRRAHPRLIELCDQLADEDAEEQRYGARRLRTRTQSDASTAAAAGFPTISISCRGDLDSLPYSHLATDATARIDERALARAFGFCSELLELIDERIGPDLAPAPTSTARPA